MKYVRFNEYIKEKSRFTEKRLRLGPRRLARTKPRDPKELEILIKLARAKMDRLLSKGEIERIGLRRWRINLTDITL
jgi:hypothetical protein